MQPYVRKDAGGLWYRLYWAKKLDLYYASIHNPLEDESIFCAK